MQFLPRMSLLASLVILFSLWQPVLSQLLTFPLKRLEHRQSDVHPQNLQMRINRGIRRLAKMTNAKSRRQATTTTPIATSPTTTTTIPVSETVVTAEPPTASDSLGFNIMDSYDPDVAYLATIKIGTPARSFSMQMDSGSYAFWVGSENCNTVQVGNKTRRGCGHHIFLGPNSSSSFRDTHKPIDIEYGKGQVSGTYVTDEVHIAGFSLPNFTFAVANLETENFSFNQSSYDGIMGLSRSTPSKPPTAIEALASLGLVRAPIVSYKLGRSLVEGENDGEITFGGLDSSKFLSNTSVTLPVVDIPLFRGAWGAHLDNVTVNGEDLGLNRTTILDTGTTLMLLPIEDAEAIHKNILGAVGPFSNNNQSYFFVPCNTTAVVALRYAGQSFTIDPQDLTWGNPDGSGYCESGISGISDEDFPDNLWLVGDTFLKNVYFSTDVSKNTVTLAKLK